jgi:hypothetical protein
MTTQNQLPENVYNRKISFITNNLSNGEVFIEPHTATGPSGIFNIPLNAITSGSKVFIPLSNTSSNGSYYLKVHLPQPGSSELYITFAQKNNSMADGYFDYTTGIPDDFRAQLRTWIIDLRDVQLGGPPLTKRLKFMLKGIDTNNTSASIPFYVSFSVAFAEKLVK